MPHFNKTVLWIGVLAAVSIAAAKAGSSKNESSIFTMTEDNKNLLWFIQISDLHLNLFQDMARIIEFREFCHYTIDAIKPPLVIASGDLTDARSNRGLRTHQIKGEWEHYANILKENNIVNKTIWMDIRGNHDGFNVITLNSKENYFANYSIQGRNNPRSYFKQLEKDGIIYSFIALDVSLVPGHREPFHFLGLLDNSQIILMKTILKQINDSGSKYSVWFGHFPTSATITQYNGGVRALIKEDKNVYAYLTGHLHNYGNLVPRMFTHHTEGFLELELGDWQNKKMFRLLAFDHGMLSFIDVHHREWPIVLVTNPKHALFVIPEKEDLNVVKHSTHIRLLVFSLSKVVLVKTKINEEDWVFCNNVDGPLFVTKWNPQKYLRGIHSLQIFVRDEDGREKTVSQPFALDGTSLSFDLSAELSLKIDLSTIFKASFWIAFAVSLLPLITFKILHLLVKAGKMTKPNIKRVCCSNYLQSFWILVTIDRLFWPLLLYPIYLVMGPWLVGYIIEDYLGVIFTWGIFVNDTFLPGGVTYDVASLQLTLFHIPLVLALAKEVKWRFANIISSNNNFYSTILHYTIAYSLFGFILIFQALVIYFFFSQFGAISAILGPIPTWSTPFAIILWYQTIVLSENCIREARKLWALKCEPKTLTAT